jgi:hypothetical protein
MFKVMIIAAAITLALGWIAYGIWTVMENIEEKKRPRPTTKHLEEVKKSFDDYLKKVKKFEKKTYERDELK